MDVSDLGRRLLGESPEISRLRHQVLDLVDLVTGPLADTGSSVPLVGLPARNAELRRLAPHVREQVIVMQTDYAYDPEDPGLELSRWLESRGVALRFATRPSTVRTHPLLSSIYPTTLVGPVFARAMVVDDYMALLGGPDDAHGNRVVWRTREPEVVLGLLAVWDATVPLCRPLLAEGAEPPLTERQLGVAKLLCVGEKDKSIARILDLSPRTVEREVSAVLRALGAGSRTEAVLLMRGRGVNGGWGGEAGWTPRH